jgi:hypothetical protein
MRQLLLPLHISIRAYIFVIGLQMRLIKFFLGNFFTKSGYFFRFAAMSEYRRCAFLFPFGYHGIASISINKSLASGLANPL